MERESRHGGDVVFEDYASLETAYIQRKLHPQDLKGAVTRYLVDLLADSREYFDKRPEALEKVKAALGI